MKLSKQDIENARKANEWSIGNNVLYSLCRKYPKHKNKREVIAKIWLIGRAYAAAIERRKKNNKMINDDFYINKVAPAITNSGIDNKLKTLRRFKKIDTRNAHYVISAHFELQNIFKSISKLNKVSLASKYLHFHLPKLFFIYDSRAKNALKQFDLNGYKVNPLDTKGKPINKDYFKFIEDCLALRKKIKDEYKIFLSPREIDNILIKVANQNGRKGKRKKKAKAA